MVIPTLNTARIERDSTRIDRVRDAFLTGSRDDLSELRPIIARSWYRSRAAGVHPELDRARVQDGRVDENTIQASEVHLRQLDDVLAEMGGYVSLTAPNGALVKPGFIRDDEGFPAGYSLLEESSGSNGEGLALEEGRGVWLAPEEHFRADMRRNWCFASLVRDPFHNRVRAVVGLTLPQDRVPGLEPSSTLLMLEGVASRIEREIELRTSSRERALLTEYLRTARRRGSSPVIAFDGKNTMMNSAATTHITDADFAVIFGYAKEVMAYDRGGEHPVTLAGCGDAVLEISPVELTGSSTGAIVVVRQRSSRQVFAEAAPAGSAQSATESAVRDALRASLHGVSAAFDRTLELAEFAVAHGRSVAIVGEAGSGRRRIADAIASLTGSSMEVDAADRTGGVARAHEHVRRGLAESPATFIIEHADELSRDEATEIAQLLRGNSRTRLILTAARTTDATMRLADACDALEIAVAPLRTRREDIPVLAGVIAAELGGRTVSRATLTTLTNSDWPRNIDQLRAVVSDAVKRARGTEVTEDDLPQGFQKLLTNGRLSRLEEAELSELRMTLREAGGNRRLAAEMLQIGRSTLYRRMDYFRGRGFDI